VAGREPIPRLDDWFGALPTARGTRDCKSDAALRPLESLLQRGDLFDRVLIGSFSDARLDHLRRRFGGDLCTSMGPRDVAALRLGRTVIRRNGRGADAVQVPVRQGPLRVLTAKLIRVAHEHDLHVHAWTIDDAATMHELLDMGVDGIMTDEPTILRNVMRERGAWL
jgi:glycerophosphoryl diester phosphodiesterase